MGNFQVSTTLELYKIDHCRAVVVAQLVEQLLPIPEVRGLNTVISKNLFIY